MSQPIAQSDKPKCPNCVTGLGEVFYEVNSVPTHSVLLFKDVSDAVGFQRGDIALAHCPDCDFIWNSSFDPDLEAYGLGYEATQAYSATFNRFHQELADHVIERFDLRNRKVLEIGCGQGEFVNLLCERGNNQGIGFDPAFDPSRRDIKRHENATFIADFYSEKYSAEDADLFCCKMTLEHIPNTLSFMTGIREAIGDRSDSAIFFMVPNVDYVLEERAFWDVYYEHCSYFTPKALAGLMTRAGFAVTDIYPAYDNQYLIVEAGVSKVGQPTLAKQWPDSGDRVEQFARDVAAFRSAWNTRLTDAALSDETVIVWGGGSKAVSFLTTVSDTQHISAAVDINPHKRNTFLPGTGHLVLGPQDLTSINPQLVVVMNPIYTDEIRSELKSISLNPKILSIREYMPCVEPTMP